MAFNKIQPEQIQMPTFLATTGDFHIDQSTSTGINLILSRNLTGNFSFTGQLLFNDKEVFGTASTGNNSFQTLSGCVLLAGSNTQIAGTNNIGILANNSTVSGINNIVLNGGDIQFNTGSQSNTTLAGNAITFANEATGSAVLKDHTSNSVTVDKAQTLIVRFETGHYFEGGPNYFSRHTSFAQSGIVSGDLEIQTSGFLTGYDIATIHDVTGYTTGRFVDLSDAQRVGGIKTYTDPQYFDSGYRLPLWSGPDMEPNVRGQMAQSGEKLLVSNGTAWYGIAMVADP
jgi:hypothetical protein